MSMSTRTLRASPLLSRARPTPVLSRATLSRPSSHDHHAPASASDEVYPEEGFTKPIWRNLALGALAVALAYRLAPASAPVTEENPHPITSYIAANMPAAGQWKANATKHLELAKEAADDKLLFQEAERPKVRRLRYLGREERAVNWATGHYEELRKAGWVVIGNSFMALWIAYPAYPLHRTFDQASPNGIPVGSQANLSDLVIKSEKEDFSWTA
ncbi:hypothetical protein P7C70_g7443, partial [Phenoliferia sp. Uapishka_3]